MLYFVHKSRIEYSSAFENKLNKDDFENVFFKQFIQLLLSWFHKQSKVESRINREINLHKNRDICHIFISFQKAMNSSKFVIK